MCGIHRRNRQDAGQSAPEEGRHWRMVARLRFAGIKCNPWTKRALEFLRNFVTLQDVRLVMIRRCGQDQSAARRATGTSLMMKSAAHVLRLDHRG